MSVIKTSETHTVTRITLHFPYPSTRVIARLKQSIAQKSDNGLEILQHVSSRPEFEATTKQYLGPHEFMLFARLEHTHWLQLYPGVHDGKVLARLIFGNPLIAKTMLEHDVRAGLFVPVEALIVDRGGEGGTDVMYVQPSELIVGKNGSRELREAAEKLDMKLEALWGWVAEELGCEG